MTPSTIADDRYIAARQRMLELLLENRDVLRPLPGLGGVFPWDEFTKLNPKSIIYPQLVLAELNYQLSEAQCSWAVVRFCESVRGAANAG